MKTKIISKLSAILLVFVMCVMTLVGCANNAKDLPDTNAMVSGNGGLAVQKGEYLYFVNGYTSVSDMQGGDNKGGDKYSAIYRVKLGDNNTVSYNEDGELENCELIIDKICGFDKTGLYIFGDYIYYATPNTEKVANDSHETVYNFELTDFYRARLDGTGRTLLYKTNLASSSTKFAFYKANGVDDVYLALFDGTKLVFVNASNKKVTTICENASSVAMPVYDIYNAENNQISKGATNIYYTRNATEEENMSGGNVIARAQIGKNEEEIISIDGVYTYTVLMANNDALVFTRKSSLEENANNYVISYAYNEAGEVSLDVQARATRLDNTAHSTVFLATYEDGNPTGMITTNSSKKLVYIKLVNGSAEYVRLNEEKELTPVLVSGNFVYAYDSENSIYQINYKTLEQKILLDTTKELEEDEVLNKPYFDAKVNFEQNGSYIYYFAEYQGNEATGYYLNRISTVYHDDGEYVTELLGVVQSNHIKTTTADEE